jgi:hypothetical protein
MESGDMTNVDPTEERTCDRCRRVLGENEELTLLVIRQDVFIVFGAVCAACFASTPALES